MGGGGINPRRATANAPAKIPTVEADIANARIYIWLQILHATSVPLRQGVSGVGGATPSIFEQGAGRLDIAAAVARARQWVRVAQLACRLLDAASFARACVTLSITRGARRHNSIHLPSEHVGRPRSQLP